MSKKEKKKKKSRTLLHLNPYYESPRRAIDLMSKICSARPADKTENLVKRLNEATKKIFNDEYLENIKAIITNPLLFKELSHRYTNLAFAINNEFFGNQPRVRVVVAGITSAGKSSLLNFLTKSKDLLPVDPDPSTIVPAHIYCSNKLAGTSIYGINQKNALIPFDKLALQGMQRKREDDEGLNSGLAQQISSSLSRCVVMCAHEWFNSIEFIDSPGFDAYDTDNSAAEQCLENPDAVLYLLDVTEGLQKPDENVLSKIQKPTIVVAHCANKMGSRDALLDAFNGVYESAKEYDHVKAFVCMSSSEPEMYGFYVGMPQINGKMKRHYEDDVLGAMYATIGNLVRDIEPHTEISHQWQEIEKLLLAEMREQDAKIKKLEADKKVVNNEMLKYPHDYNRLKELPYKVRAGLDKAQYYVADLAEDCVTERVIRLTEEYNVFRDRYDSQLKKLYDLYGERIKQCKRLQENLESLHHVLLHLKEEAEEGIGEMDTPTKSSVQYVNPFEAVEDVYDVELTKLINSLSVGEGFDVVGIYNDGGFSLLTYSAYCGNVPALRLMMGRLKSFQLSKRDDKGRNIIDAASEGGHSQLVKILSQKFPELV